MRTGASSSDCSSAPDADAPTRCRYVDAATTDKDRYEREMEEGGFPLHGDPAAKKQKLDPATGSATASKSGAPTAAKSKSGATASKGGQPSLANGSAAAVGGGGGGAVSGGAAGHGDGEREACRAAEQSHQSGSISVDRFEVHIDSLDRWSRCRARW